jgi:hypothetical protein
MHTLQEEVTIQEILAEAGSYGLRAEVIKSAEQIWAENREVDDFTLLDAYQEAYSEWIK